MATRGLNKVMLIGHVGRDPEIKYTPGGLAVATFSVATNESFKDKEGKQQDRTEWHRIVAFGRTAEVMGEYLKKGQLVYVEGRLQTRSWDDDKGQKRYITEIVANSVQFLSRKGEGVDTGAAAEIPPPGDDFAPPSAGEASEDLPF
ncbi:MAG: Single-stranded DNA-binding protein [bacterium]|nr:Single-stranded DNA-binding protein [bacterium]MCK6559684.1 single-stranded DNA-binding protein [bacterium]NUM65642.1 single-stranded DNA-binding protein [candidate division KSB1 bacterium]